MDIIFVLLLFAFLLGPLVAIGYGIYAMYLACKTDIFDGPLNVRKKIVTYLLIHMALIVVTVYIPEKYPIFDYLEKKVGITNEN